MVQKSTPARSLRLVAVDDDRNVRRLVEQVFPEPAFETATFATAEEALSGIRHRRPDLILCDYLMPGMGAEPLIRALQATPDLRTIPILFLTAAMLSEEEGRDLGAAAVLRKPCSVLDLRREVETHLPPRAAALAEPPASPATAVEAQARGERALPARRRRGRYSLVAHNGRPVQVFTEEVDRPTFSVVTVVTSGGRGLRHVESSLPHPLRRTEDDATADAEIDFQHDTVLANLDQYIVTAPRLAVWADERRQVPSSLLEWVIATVSSSLARRCGAEAARRLLVETHTRCAASATELRRFRFSNVGRASYEPERGESPSLSTAGALAGWMIDLLREGLGTTTAEARTTVERLVEGRAAALERFGFMRALARQGELGQDEVGVRVDGLDGPAGRRTP